LLLLIIKKSGWEARIVWDAIDSAVIRVFAAKELHEELTVFEAVGDLRAWRGEPLVPRAQSVL
jgi:hypothetical protein